MAFDGPAEPSRHHLDGLRGLDHLDSGVQQGSERLPDPRWIRLHGAFRKNRDHLHLVRAWLVLICFTSTGSVAIATIITRGGH